MKISPQKFESLLSSSQSPSPFFGFGTILIFGPDHGSIRNYSERCIKKLLGTPPDPFRFNSFFWNNAQETGLLIADCLNEFPLSGGHRVVQVRQVTDSFLAPLKDILTHGTHQSFLLLEGDDLPAKSTLRKFMEAHGQAGLLGCYPLDEKEQAYFIERTLTAHGMRADRDGLLLLQRYLPAHKLAIENEITKLALYLSPQPTTSSSNLLTVDIISLCLGDQGEISLHDLVYSFAGQKLDDFSTHYPRCLAEGETPISIIRAVLRHLQQFWRARVIMDGQQLSLDQAVIQLKPPIFYKYQAAFCRQFSLWPLERLMATFLELTNLEIRCKQPHAPASEITFHQLLQIMQINS
ncbi:MAG: DNA polymerase III subunit delta [Rhodospirillaceae bacterium]|nr:DNA polymerase III subunit delta [Rhodospirillaceae bacterium]